MNDFLCVHFVCRDLQSCLLLTMPAPENNRGSRWDDDGDPPSLSIEVKKLSDLPKTSKQWSNVHLPGDILLLTVENCEFLACHYYLRDAFKSYSQTLGYVYFGNMGDQDKPWKVAFSEVFPRLLSSWWLPDSCYQCCYPIETQNHFLCWLLQRSES